MGSCVHQSVSVAHHQTAAVDLMSTVLPCLWSMCKPQTLTPSSQVSITANENISDRDSSETAQHSRCLRHFLFCFVFVVFFPKYQILLSGFRIFFSCLRTPQNIALWKSKRQRENTDESGHLALLGHSQRCRGHILN